MKRSAIVLLIVGLVVESAGYMIDKAGFFSFIVRGISPTFVHGEEAVRALRAGNALVAMNPRFEAVVQGANPICAPVP